MVWCTHKGSAGQNSSAPVVCMAACELPLDASIAIYRSLISSCQVFNFIFFSLLGIIWEAFLIVQKESQAKSWSEIFNSLDSTFAKITKAYISQSSYWLSWFP